MMHVLELVEDERCFLSQTFLKDKINGYLSVVVGIYVQQSTFLRIIFTRIALSNGYMVLKGTVMLP